MNRDNGLTAGRRDFLKTAGFGVAGFAGGVTHGSWSVVSEAQAQTVQAPRLAEQKWWPSKWGAGDEAGATNHCTPAKVLDTIKYIKDGKIYKLARNYEQAMPCFGKRSFMLRMPSAPTGGPFGENKLVYNDEYLATEIGQTGTQFDGLGHIGVQMGNPGDLGQMIFYNGVTMAEMADPYGLKKLGVEKLKPIFTRGHLVDIEAVKGAMMDVGQEITVADLRAAFAKQNMNEADVKPGDAIFFNTGWGRLWMKNNDRFNSGEPGIGLEVAKWIVDNDLVMTGADTWATEVVPNPDKGLAFPVHAELLTKHGILNHENLVFDELIADKKYQFVFIFPPVPIKGATGSNGCPIAIT
jgi:kynurenine formamidase